jgi:hypothetical protein
MTSALFEGWKDSLRTKVPEGICLLLNNVILETLGGCEDVVLREYGFLEDPNDALKEMLLCGASDTVKFQMWNQTSQKTQYYTPPV